MSDLADEVGALLARAAEAADDDTSDRLGAASGRLRQPLVVAVAGRVKAGKSTLVNALLGEEVAPTDEAECTRVITWYRHGSSYRVEVIGKDGSRHKRPFHRGARGLDVDLGLVVEDIDHVDVWLPNGQLRDLTLIDTPGLESVSTEVSARSVAALADVERPAVADAVIFLLRHLHAGDVRFLEAFHGSELACGSSVNAIGVLSRADEIGLARMDAMETADRVAERYRSEPALRRLCPVILPVAGLLATAASTLQEQDFGAIAQLAAQPREIVVNLLLTAQGFATADAAPVSSEIRAGLLDRLGLFGIRTAVHLVRRGEVRSSDHLARALRELGGLERLQEVLRTEFHERASLLKARSGLAVLDDVLESGAVTDPDWLRRDSEALRSGAHELVEIRVASAVRSGEVRLRGGGEAELVRLLGGNGHDAAARLGLPSGADPAEIRDAATEAGARWRSRANHPLSSAAVRTACEAAVRSCERLLTDAVDPQ